MASTSNKLGELRKLPPEIRVQIWKEFRPRRDADPPSHLAILRVCHELTEEIIPEIYDKEILRIGVGPPGSVSSHWLAVENEYGAFWTIPTANHSLYRKFSRLPFKKLKRVRISIHAPETDNLAELYCLCKDVRDLVALLEQAKNRLPPLDIELLDTPSGKWTFDDGTPLKTVPETVAPDYLTILLPFCRLRRVPKVTIQVPANFIPEGAILQNIARLMQLKVPFGRVKHSVWDDEQLQRSLDASWIDYEDILDEAPGPVANMLRLERFISWYRTPDGKSTYMDKYKRILSTCSKNVSENRLMDLQSRHDFLLLLNPLSASMQKMRLQLHLPSLLRTRPSRSSLANRWSIDAFLDYLEEVEVFEGNGQLSDADKAPGDKLRSCWASEQTWRDYYPEGIPPLDLDVMLDFSVAMSDETETEMERIETEMGEEEGSYWSVSTSFESMGRKAARVDFGGGERIREAFERWFEMPWTTFYRSVDVDVEMFERYGFY